ncbi:MAG: glutamate-1-semialdehyde 2,1-aminomutase [Zetaproteobacteria bacterium]|nr:glutamate-1-semialdehyde 2,1-aminomutase [Zetaproteobacteria bacterium]
MSQRIRSAQLAQAACKLMPGGVSSPVRAFNSVGGSPVYIKQAKGCRVEDVDDNSYVDYVGSWGPAIVGHAHPEVIKHVQTTATQGLSFGAPTAAESELAAQICDAIPCAEQVRFVSSGTEACMSAIRLARAATGRDKIIKFSGHYHGHSDSLLVAAGSGVTTLALPGSTGVPQGAVADTLISHFNDSASVRRHFEEYPQQIAAIIVEPIAGNSNFIRPEARFLEQLRGLCNQHQTLLIVDEVMTGFRIAYGGYCTKYNLDADIVTLGKVIGGGMPLAAYCGRKQWMQHIAPSGKMYQAGTLSGNPIATAAGLKTLEILQRDAQGAYEQLASSSKYLTAGLAEIMATHQIPFSYDYEGGMFGFAFRPSMPKNYEEALTSSQELFSLFFNRMLDLGHYFAPSAFEAGFISLQHTQADIDSTLRAAETVAMELTQTMKKDTK